jgi:hypothetical protein
MKTETNDTGIATAFACLACLAGLAALPAISQETYSTWGQHKFVGVNTLAAGAGANVGGNVRNFPVLVRLDSANFAAGFAQSAGRGADLRFTKLGDAIRLQHQIERWDSAAKKAEVWVRLDTVYGNRVTSFRMHWAKAGSADSSSGARVFDTAQGFQAVWHLNETANDSARDASRNRFTGVPSGTPGSVPGIVGLARSFNGTSQHFEVPGSASGRLNFPLDGIYTLSAWAYIDAASAVVDRVIAAKHDNQYALKISTDNRWQFFEYDGNWTIAGGTYESGRWTHLTGVLNGRDTYLYVDGLEVEAVLDCCSGGGSRNETANFFIGRAGESARRWWWGNIDELRVASVARSSDWARLEYHNQKPAATMMIYADTLPVVSLAAAPGPRRTGSVQAVADGYRFSMTGAARARFEVTGLGGRLLWRDETTARDGMLETTWRSSGTPRGIYTVRLTALDAAGKPLATEAFRLSLTR